MADSGVLGLGSFITCGPCNMPQKAWQPQVIALSIAGCRIIYLNSLLQTRPWQVEFDISGTKQVYPQLATCPVSTGFLGQGCDRCDPVELFEGETSAEVHCGPNSTGVLCSSGKAQWRLWGASVGLMMLDALKKYEDISYVGYLSP